MRHTIHMLTLYLLLLFFAVALAFFLTLKLAQQAVEVDPDIPAPAYSWEPGDEGQP